MKSLSIFDRTLFLLLAVLSCFVLLGNAWLSLTWCLALGCLFGVWRVCEIAKKFKAAQTALKNAHDQQGLVLEGLRSELDDQRTISAIQTPLLNQSLEGFFHSLLAELLEHLKAAHISIFLNDQADALNVRAWLSDGDACETFLFFRGTGHHGKDGELHGLSLDRDNIDYQARAEELVLLGNLCNEETGRKCGSLRSTFYALPEKDDELSLVEDQLSELRISNKRLLKVLGQGAAAWDRGEGEQGQDQESSAAIDGDWIYTYALDGNLGGLEICFTGGRDFDDARRKQLENYMAASQRGIASAIEREQTYLKSITDSMTGLFSKRHFTTSLQDYFRASQRYHQTGALILLDIDHFKKFNDDYGHLTGDHVLCEVSRLLQEGIRDVDTAFRYGGEELAILLPHTSGNDAYILAERLREAIANCPLKTCDTPAKDVQVTVSIGVSEVASSMNEFTHWVASADKALYAAKDGGRNRVCIAEAEKGVAFRKLI